MPIKVVTMRLFARNSPASIFNDDDVEVVCYVAKAMYGTNYRRHLNFLKLFYSRNKDEIKREVFFSYNL